MLLTIVKQTFKLHFGTITNIVVKPHFKRGLKSVYYSAHFCRVQT